MGQQLRLKQMWTLTFPADPLPTSILFPCCLVPRDLHVCAPAPPHLLPALPSLLSPGSLNFLGLDCPLDWFLSFKPRMLGNVYAIGWCMSVPSRLCVYSWERRPRSLPLGRLCSFWRGATINKGMSDSNEFQEEK